MVVSSSGSFEISMNELSNCFAGSEVASMSTFKPSSMLKLLAPTIDRSHHQLHRLVVGKQHQHHRQSNPYDSTAASFERSVLKTLAFNKVAPRDCDAAAATNELATTTTTADVGHVHKYDSLADQQRKRFELNRMKDKLASINKARNGAAAASVGVPGALNDDEAIVGNHRHHNQIKLLVTNWSNEVDSASLLTSLSPQQTRGFAADTDNKKNSSGSRSRGAPPPPPLHVKLSKTKLRKHKFIVTPEYLINHSSLSNQKLLSNSSSLKLKTAVNFQMKKSTQSSQTTTAAAGGLPADSRGRQEAVAVDSSMWSVANIMQTQSQSLSQIQAHFQRSQQQNQPTQQQIQHRLHFGSPRSHRSNAAVTTATAAAQAASTPVHHRQLAAQHTQIIETRLPTLMRMAAANEATANTPFTITALGSSSSTSANSNIVATVIATGNTHTTSYNSSKATQSAASSTIIRDCEELYRDAYERTSAGSRLLPVSKRIVNSLHVRKISPRSKYDEDHHPHNHHSHAGGTALRPNVQAQPHPHLPLTPPELKITAASFSAAAAAYLESYDNVDSRDRGGDNDDALRMHTDNKLPQLLSASNATAATGSTTTTAHSLTYQDLAELSVKFEQLCQREKTSKSVKSAKSSGGDKSQADTANSRIKSSSSSLLLAKVANSATSFGDLTGRLLLSSNEATSWTSLEQKGYELKTDENDEAANNRVGVSRHAADATTAVGDQLCRTSRNNNGDPSSKLSKVDNKVYLDIFIPC